MPAHNAARFPARWNHLLPGEPIPYDWGPNIINNINYETRHGGTASCLTHAHQDRGRSGGQPGAGVSYPRHRFFGFAADFMTRAAITASPSL